MLVNQVSQSQLTDNGKTETEGEIHGWVPKIIIGLENMSQVALVDTGSSVSVIFETLFEAITSKNKELPVLPTAITGRITKITKKFYYRCRLKRMDWLVKKRIMIDIHNKELLFVVDRNVIKTKFPENNEKRIQSIHFKDKRNGGFQGQKEVKDYDKELGSILEKGQSLEIGYDLNDNGNWSFRLDRTESPADFTPNDGSSEDIRRKRYLKNGKSDTAKSLLERLGKCKSFKCTLKIARTETQPPIDVQDGYKLISTIIQRCLFSVRCSILHFPLLDLSLRSVLRIQARRSEIVKNRVEYRRVLIGVECSCTHSFLSQVCLTKTLTLRDFRYEVQKAQERTCFHNRSQKQEESTKDRVCSFGNVKTALTV
ncbi:hypothetical protein FQA39_LY12106 [Lamprigera yunnana]|nr:hypothetical protein FQA39_LY12106 [Lamprigera yunnana]